MSDAVHIDAIGLMHNSVSDRAASETLSAIRVVNVEAMMPKGPQGQKRSADVIGSAIVFAPLGTQEITEDLKKPSGRGRNGLASLKARAESMTKEERSAAAKQAASVRWG